MSTNKNAAFLLAALGSLQVLVLTACSDAAHSGAFEARAAAQSKTSSTAAKSSSPTTTAGTPARESSGATPVAVASLKELMDSTVDPAADGIWDSVAVISTVKGTETHQPRTPQEWAAVRRHAITLIEAMNLVVLPGRHAAPAGTKPGLGELEPTQIERDIAAKGVVFATFAKALQDTARHALDAIDRKDIDAIVRTGGEIDAACEACHVTFWYPNQR